MSMNPAKLRAVVLEWVEQIRHGSGGSDEDAIEIIRTIGGLDRPALLDIFRMMDEGEEADEIVGSAMAGGTPTLDANDARPSRTIKVIREEPKPDDVIELEIIGGERLESPAYDIEVVEEPPAWRGIKHPRPGLETYQDSEPEPIKPTANRRKNPGLESWTQEKPATSAEPDPAERLRQVGEELRAAESTPTAGLSVRERSVRHVRIQGLRREHAKLIEDAKWKEIFLRPSESLPRVRPPES